MFANEAENLGRPNLLLMANLKNLYASIQTKNMLDDR
jgi:hypothetical protein